MCSVKMYMLAKYLQGARKCINVVEVHIFANYTI